MSYLFVKGYITTCAVSGKNGIPMWIAIIPKTLVSSAWNFTCKYETNQQELAHYFEEMYCNVNFIITWNTALKIWSFQHGNSGLIFFKRSKGAIFAFLCFAYALRVLRKQGLCDDSLHDIFRAVAVAKLMYASNAWWGFSNVNDRQKIGLFAFIRRCIRTGFCSPDLADVLFLYVSSDEKLFNKILTCPNHILRTILPPPSAQNYSPLFEKCGQTQVAVYCDVYF